MVVILAERYDVSVLGAWVTTTVWLVVDVAPFESIISSVTTYVPDEL